MTSQEPVAIHVAANSSEGYGSATPDAFMVRPLSSNPAVGNREYYLAGYHEMSAGPHMYVHGFS